MRLNKLGFIAALCPLAVVALASCGSNTISAPGNDITLDEAKKYVSDNYEVRNNLAKSTDFTVTFKNLTAKGISYIKLWDSIDPNRVDISVNGEKMVHLSMPNKAGAVGAFMIDNAYRSFPIFSTNQTSYLDYLFNPWLTADELVRIESIKTLLKDESALTTRYSKDGDNLFVTYDAKDLAAVTDVIARLAEQDPYEAFVFPFAGTGTAKIIMGFDKYGYPIKLEAQIDSDDLVVRTRASSKVSDNPFFEGKAHGTLSLENKVALYDKAFPHIDFKQFNEKGEEVRMTYTPRAPKTLEESILMPATESVLVDYYFAEFGQYFNQLLPGYGSKIVFDDLEDCLKLPYPLSTRGIENLIVHDCIYIETGGSLIPLYNFTIDPKTSEPTSKYVSVSMSNDTSSDKSSLCIYLKEDILDICDSDFNIVFHPYLGK